MSFVREFQDVQREVHAIAQSKGWWDDGSRGAGELIALMHSELSEALEGFRQHNPPSDKIPEFTQVEEEFADTIIRIMDASEWYGMRVAEAIVAKMEYNRKRTYKHGGKAF